MKKKPSSTRARRAAYHPDDVYRHRILIALGWYSVAIHKGIARYAKEANWGLDLSMTRSGMPPLNWNGDGIISLVGRDTPLHRFIESARCPCVNIGDVVVPGFPTVRSDNQKIGEIAAAHFIERGFKNIAFCMTSNVPTARDRGAALRSAVERSGRNFFILDWQKGGSKSVEQNRKRMEVWFARKLKKLPTPIAILCEHDETAIDAMQACIDCGLKIPEQVAILGIDDDSLRCDFTPVSLSSIDSNQEMEGYRAAAVLDEILRGKVPSEEVINITPVGVTVRRSTDILSVDNANVATALRHIWNNYTKPINAKTVSAMVSVSYRYLHDAFRESIGRTIAEEITYKRLERAKVLLVETDLRGRDIAFECGFPNDTRLGCVFKREMGMTPMEYRELNRKSL